MKPSQRVRDVRVCIRQRLRDGVDLALDTLSVWANLTGRLQYGRANHLSIYVLERIGNRVTLTANVELTEQEVAMLDGSIEISSTTAVIDEACSDANEVEHAAERRACQLPHLLCSDRGCDYYSILASMKCAKCRAEREAWARAIERAAMIVSGRRVQGKPMTDQELARHIRDLLFEPAGKK